MGEGKSPQETVKEDDNEGGSLLEVELESEDESPQDGGQEGRVGGQQIQYI